MKTETTRNYQSALEALQVMRQAERAGRAVEVTASGDLKLAKTTPPHSGLRWLFHRLFGSGSADKAEQQRKAAIATVVNKMKIEVASSSAHVSKMLQIHLTDLAAFQHDGKLRNLDNEWSGLKNRMDLDRERDALEASLQQASVAAASPPSSTITAVTADSAADSAAGSKTDSPPDAVMPVAAKPATATRAPAAAYDQLQIRQIRQALPPEIDFRGDCNTVMEARWQISAKQHGKILRTLEAVESVPLSSILNPDSDDDDDDDLSDASAPRIGSQFVKDAGRATFIFNDHGLSMRHELGADPNDVLQGLQDLVGDSGGKTLQTLSSLLSQEALGALLIPLIKQNPARSGNKLGYVKTSTVEPQVTDPAAKGGRRNVAQTQFTFTVTNTGDGKIEVGLVQREKIHYLMAGMDMIPVNRGADWEGDIDDDNYGYQISTRLRFSLADLQRAYLGNPEVLEPTTMQFRLQVAPPEEA